MKDVDRYTLESYGWMFANETRHPAYAAALERAISPGDVVLEIGTGIGVYAMMAAKLGAKKIYAVESNPLVQLAEEMAKINGFGDQIEFIEGLSTEIELPEKADVIFSDLRGVLPLHTQHLTAVRDARERHLAPGGVMIPEQDRIMAAVVSEPSEARSYRKIWLNNAFDLDLSRALEEETKRVREDRAGKADLMSEPFTVANLDYRLGLENTGLQFAATVKTVRAGVAHGISAWFDATALEDIQYSTGPGHPETVHGMAFFPFLEPVELPAGSSIDIEMSAHPAGDYVWTWKAAAETADGERWSASQTSIAAAGINADRLQKRKASYRPVPTAEMRADQLVLQGLVAGESLGEIADALVSSYPDLVSSRASALTLAANLAESYE